MTRRLDLPALQARAKAAADRRADDTNGRVIVTLTPTPAAEDGTSESEGGGSAELWLYGTVGGYWWGFDSDDVAAALRGLGDVDNLLIRLHSFGGNAIEGIAIANLLANHPATVKRIVVDGVAASAASMIALAGTELIMSPGSQLMVHDAWLCTCGNAAELRADAEWIDKQSQNYAETYAHRAGGTAASWRSTMLANNGDGTWFSAQEAVDAGLASQVANIASTQPPPPMPSPVDLDDPDVAAAAEWDLEVLIHPAARAAWSSWSTSKRPGAPKPPAASAPGHTKKKGAAVVDLNDQQITALREQVGFAEDADADTIVAATIEALTERADPSASDIPAGHVTIPAVRLADLEAAAGRSQQSDQRAQDSAKALHNQERKTFLDGVRTKYLPTSRAGWEAEYDRDPDAVRKHFATAPDLVPTELIGHEVDVPESEDTPTTLAQVRENPDYQNWEF